MYEGKETRMQRHKKQKTAVNKKFANVNDEQPDKHEYRHANMKDGGSYDDVLLTDITYISVANRWV